MIKKIITFLLLLFVLPVFAQDSDYQTTEEILDLVHQEDSTVCASEIFLEALKEHADEIDEENDTEYKVRAWAQETMTRDAKVLSELLNCPEIKDVDEYTTIIFSPVVFTFPGGRTITVNYSTQPKVLKQKLILANKPSLPSETPNPKLMDPNDPAKYLNTEPAWYAIMVVQHDSLKDFVGPGKNNTISIKYIDENIDKLYPHGYHCTSRSAIALDSDTINNVVHEVVGLEKDSNDYYVAGDINLEWIMYAEIAADIIITVATAGGGQVLTGALKGLRATKTGMKIAKNMNRLKKFARVKKYIKTTNQIEHIENYQKIFKNLEKARKKGKNITKYEKELKESFDAIKRIDPSMTETALRDPDKVKDILKGLRKTTDELTNVSKELKSKKKLLNQARKNADPLSVKDYEKKLKELDRLRDAQENSITISRIKNPEKKAKALEKYNQQEQRIKELEKIIKDYEGASTLGDYPKLKREVDELESVQKYIKQSEQLGEILKYHKSLTAFRRPQTGNIITRNLKKIIKPIRAIKGGEDVMAKAGKVARAGMSSRSAKIGNWLFDATLKHGSRLAQYESRLGKLYGLVTVAKFVGDMYDYTSTTSKEFSNGIEFKPLCLLSADDLDGQDNVVNYGMWLMWTGNSTDSADDDAAYLQAMDFASKFFYTLDEYQDEHEPQCNVDIYVVRPIIRLDETNVEDPEGELFYLFMNEIPWSTAEQFSAAIPDVEDWERTQVHLEQQDPDNKYKKTTKEESDLSDYDDDEDYEEDEDIE